MLHQPHPAHLRCESELSPPFSSAEDRSGDCARLRTRLQGEEQQG